jgi:hypothetical protein
MARPWRVGLACSIAVLIAFGVGLSVGRRGGTDRVASTAAASNASPPSPSTDRARLMARERETAQAQLEWIKSGADVDTYLGQLEAQAERKGEVTADEVIPGGDVIRAMAPVLGQDQAMRKNRDFHIRMAELSAQLRARRSPSAL